VASPSEESSISSIGIILGVLALGFVVFRKYFKIGLVRTSSSKGSNRLDISSKHVKKNVKSSHIGIFALAFLTLLLTVPSAFAQETGIPNAASHAQASFDLMEKITDGQTELATLENLVTSNGLNMGVGLTEYADALEQAVYLASSDNPEDWDEAAAILDGSETIIDDVYTQLYAQVDSRQNERFTDFVENAKYSITFILDNVDVSEPVYNELQATLDIFEDGDYGTILAATSESSDAGLTASMIPGFDKASDTGKEYGQGIGIGLGQVPPGIDNLPDEIKERYDIPTDSNLSTESYEDAFEEAAEAAEELAESYEDAFQKVMKMHLKKPLKLQRNLQKVMKMHLKKPLKLQRNLQRNLQKN